MTCNWIARFKDLSTLESLYMVSCKPDNFITEFDPSEITYCPYCGNEIIENEDTLHKKP